MTTHSFLFKYQLDCFYILMRQYLRMKKKTSQIEVFLSITLLVHFGVSQY